MSARDEQSGLPSDAGGATLLRRLWECLPDGLFALSRESRTFTATNPAMSRLTGYSAEELRALKLSDLAPPKQRAEVERYLDQLLAAEGEVPSLVFPMLAKDGSRRLVEVHALACAPGELCGILRDVTQASRVEELQRAIVNSMVDPVVVIDAELNIVAANRAAYLALRLDPDARELEGKNVSELVTADDLPRVRDALQQVLSGKSVSSIPLNIAHPAGVTEVSASGNLLRDRDGTAYVVAVLHSLEEIQERHARELRVERMAGVGQLASGVAHEFNNLLAIMQGYAQFALTRSGVPQPVRDALDNIIVATRRAAEITRNLLDFAQPCEPLRSRCDIINCIERAIANLRDDLERSNIRVLRNYGPVPLAFVDGGQLEQVFANIISNAIHAMPQGGELRIAAKPVSSCAGVSQPALEISIADTGEGIPAEYLDRIFEPFFTTKGARGTSGIPGTGLGLSVAHGIVKAHGGEISVDSAVGQGTTFTIRIPLGELAPEEPEESIPTPAPEHPAPLNILVVDDEMPIRRLLSAALAQGGHNVVTASDGEQALKLLDEQRFDVALVDILMPQLDGIETMRLMHEKDPTIPVIIITGKGERALEQEALAAGARAYLRKPFAMDTILEVVESAARPAER